MPTARYNVHSVHAKTEELSPGRVISSPRTGGSSSLNTLGCKPSCWEYRDFGLPTRASIEFALLAVGIEPNESITGLPLDKYLDLDPAARPRMGLAG
jgi:hypothetical protein